MGIQSYNTVQVLELARAMRETIFSHFAAVLTNDYTRLKVYAVPRGGIPARLALLALDGDNVFAVTDNPAAADLIVDDLIDSGETALKFGHLSVPFFALLDKRVWTHGDDWVVWPWEGDSSAGIEGHVRRLIQYAGDDPTRGGLIETPARVAKAWRHWCSGYDTNPASLLKTFEDGAEGANEMVLVRNIPFFSHCEHHMAPFFGTATVGYIPNGKIVGLSKLNRLVDCFARRLQVQERMTTQIADAIADNLEALGVGVIVTARHLCVESRGVAHHGSDTTTSALRGVMVEGRQRQEFLLLAR